MSCDDTVIFTKTTNKINVKLRLSCSMFLHVSLPTTSSPVPRPSLLHERLITLHAQARARVLIIVALCLPEVTNVDIDMEGQKVLVTSTLGSDELLAKLKKTGRECSYVGVKE